MADDLIELVRLLPRVQLDELDAPDTPGAYLQFLAAPNAVPVLGMIAEGRYPSYAGVAAVSLRERLGRYRVALRGVAAIAESEVYIAIVPCASRASAAFAEAALIERLNPVLNGLGYGAKVPGAKRVGRRCKCFRRAVPGAELGAEGVRAGPGACTVACGVVLGDARPQRSALESTSALK